MVLDGCLRVPYTDGMIANEKRESTKIKRIDDARVGTKRVVAGRLVAGPSVQDLQRALTEINGDARLCGNEGGSSTVHVTESNGFPPRQLHLLEETLTDGSKVFSVVILF
jgi:hypothetical protein